MFIFQRKIYKIWKKIFEALFFPFRSCLKRKVTETSSVPLTDIPTIEELTNPSGTKLSELNSKSAGNHVIIPAGTLSDLTRPKSADQSVTSLNKDGQTKSQGKQNVKDDKITPSDSNATAKQVRTKIRSADSKKRIERQQTIQSSNGLPGPSTSAAFTNPAFER